MIFRGDIHIFQELPFLRIVSCLVTEIWSKYMTGSGGISKLAMGWPELAFSHAPFISRLQ
jgi:hypothetical protein